MKLTGLILERQVKEKIQRHYIHNLFASIQSAKKPRKLVTPVSTDYLFIVKYINFHIDLWENLKCVQWRWLSEVLILFYKGLFSGFIIMELEHLNFICLWVYFAAV